MYKFKKIISFNKKKTVLTFYCQTDFHSFSIIHFKILFLEEFLDKHIIIRFYTDHICTGRQAIG